MTRLLLAAIASFIAPQVLADEVIGKTAQMASAVGVFNNSAGSSTDPAVIVIFRMMPPPLSCCSS